MRRFVRDDTLPSSRLWPARSAALLLVAVFLVLFAGCGAAGSRSDESSDSPGPGDKDPPTAPSGLQALPESQAVGLDWDAVEAADSYRVYRSTSSGTAGSGSPVAEVFSSSSYTDEGLENGTAYFYVITAVASEGGESAESDASGEAGAVPFAPPSGLEGTSRDSEVALNWDAAAGAETYSVYRSTFSTDGAEGDPLATEVTATSYADSTAVNGTKYYYRVTSFNRNDVESDPSGEVEKTPFSDPPGQP